MVRENKVEAWNLPLGVVSRECLVGSCLGTGGPPLYSCKALPAELAVHLCSAKQQGQLPRLLLSVASLESCACCDSCCAHSSCTAAG